MEKISVVIPCYRSEKLIEGVINELIGELEKLKAYDYEIILVSDSSPDNVFDIIEKMAMENGRIKGVELARNFGQHSALMAGYGFAKGDIIVSMDDDGQSPPKDIGIMVEKIQGGADVVYADYPVVQQNIFRRAGSHINKYMMEKLLSKPKDLTTNSFFAARRFVVDEMLNYKNPYPYLGGLVLRSTNHVEKIPVEQRKRSDGKSGYSFRKLFTLWVNGFTAFSIKPLRIATIIGALCAIMGFIFGAFVVIRKLVKPETLLGYSSTMAMLVFVGGMIMLMLGIIGEYVGRIYISINNSPQYVIRRQVGIENSAAKTNSAENNSENNKL